MYVQEIADAVENGDTDVFEEKVFSYDQMSKLDKWKTTMLLRIKETIAAVRTIAPLEHF